MKAIVATMVLVMLVAGFAFAAPTDVDESKLSPEAKALKAKYDAQIQALQTEFMTELADLAARLDAVEKAPAKKNWYDGIKINGYFQARFHARDYQEPVSTTGAVSTAAAANDIEDFEMRRLYINIIAPFDKQTMAVVTWAGVGPGFRAGPALTSNTDWANMFVDYKPAPEWTVRVGQAPTWFGLDTCESSSCRFTPERFAASEGIPAFGLNGLYFAGPWDRGVWIVNDQTAISPDKTGLRTVFSVHNGNFRNQDSDQNKNISLDLEYFTKWGQVGASWLDGKFGGTARDALGVNVRVNPNGILGPWGVQAEWLDGEWMGTDRDGWYGQASYSFANHPGTAYARYEEFDPNKDAASDEYEALHLGYIYDITPVDKVTLEYTLGEYANNDADDLIVQYQRMF